MDVLATQGRETVDSYGLRKGSLRRSEGWNCPGTSAPKVRKDGRERVRVHQKAGEELKENQMSGKSKPPLAGEHEVTLFAAKNLRIRKARGNKYPKKPGTPVLGRFSLTLCRGKEGGKVGQRLGGLTSSAHSLASNPRPKVTCNSKNPLGRW